MDRNPHADEELNKRRKDDEVSSSSGTNPSPHYRETPTTFTGAVGWPCEADKGSLGFMDLLGIQDGASALSAGYYSILDLLQPPPSALPSRRPPLPSVAPAAPEPSSEMVSNQPPTPASSSPLSPLSSEWQTNKAAEEGEVEEEEEEEDEEEENNQHRTKKQ